MVGTVVVREATQSHNSVVGVSRRHFRHKALRLRTEWQLRERLSKVPQRVVMIHLDHPLALGFLREGGAQGGYATQGSLLLTTTPEGSLSVL